MKMKSILLTSSLVALFLMASGCNRQVSYHALSQVAENPVQDPTVLAVYLPWFGDRQHIKVGYRSDDPEVQRKQIARARDMGVQGFVVDWYGDRRPFLDHSYALLQRVASQNHFKVAIMYDETEDDNGQATDEALAAMTEAYAAYLRPGAPGRDAYLEYNGRPVIFIFPKRGHTDWNRVRAFVNGWASPPLLIYKEMPPPQMAGAFDGYYPWVHPGSKGWAPNGENWGKDYLESFYQRMKGQPDKITVGTVWPGFDDSKASWSLNRRIDDRCGKTWDDTMQLFHSYNQIRPMPFLLIATWNDYEEGTAIEPGVRHKCGG